MARLPYADLSQLDAEGQALVQRIEAERGSVLHLYQMLLHSPPLAAGWLHYLTAVRQQLSIPGALRELIILRVAQLNGAPYEAAQHAPIALKEGVSPAQLDALEGWRESALFDASTRAVLALTDAMTRDIHFDAALTVAVRAHLGERATVEVAATIAAYNMVSRFLEALAIDIRDER
ncbi:MAG: carboxymuconolactone decarboxylase family protein [Rubrivivax sp.]|nr:carboxymuconolactone decarboxylase family protein [Rubrivivax sp.]